MTKQELVSAFWGTPLDRMSRMKLLGMLNELDPDPEIAKLKADIASQRNTIITYREGRDKAVAEVETLKRDVSRLHTENKRLRLQHVALGKAHDRLKAENASLRKDGLDKAACMTELAVRCEERNSTIAELSKQLKRPAGTLTPEQAADHVLGMLARGWVNSDETLEAVADIIRQVASPQSGETTMNDLIYHTALADKPGYVNVEFTAYGDGRACGWEIFRSTNNGENLRGTGVKPLFDALKELATPPKPKEVTLTLTRAEAESVMYAMGGTLTDKCKAALAEMKVKP